MDFLQMILVVIGLSLDVFAYGLYKGAMVSRIHKINLLKMVGIFSGFQMGMLLIGAIITMIPAIHPDYNSANRLWEMAAAVLFFGLGIWMILRSFNKKYKKIEEQVNDTFDYKMIIFWSFMTSLDALIAGFGFGLLSMELWITIITLGIVTAVSVIAGVCAGYLLGCGPMNRFIGAGGGIVIVGGIDILIHFFQNVR